MYTKIDITGFKTLDNEIYAYWTGFIAADGCVFSKGTTHLVNLKLSATENEHLEKFRLNMGLENPVRVDPKGIYSIISVTSRDFYEILAKWGILPRKSLTIQWPANLPEKAIPHFIRGYFDGNGTIYQRNRVGPKTGAKWHETVCRFISGSPDFLKRLEIELNQRGIITNKTYRNGDTNAYVLPLSGRIDNLSRFGNFIYTPGAVCLERKKIYFDNLLEKAA